MEMVLPQGNWGSHGNHVSRGNELGHNSVPDCPRNSIFFAKTGMSHEENCRCNIITCVRAFTVLAIDKNRPTVKSNNRLTKRIVIDSQWINLQ